MAGRKLLLFGTDRWGPGTICGGLRIAQGALRQLSELCVLAVTDTSGVGELMGADRFDHVRLSRPGSTAASIGLRKRLIREILASYQPDLVLALRCSAGQGNELLEPLAAERARRPEMRTALALWDVPTENELEVLSSQSDRYHQLFDELWSFGDPAVHNRRKDLPDQLANELVDLGYATCRTETPLTAVAGGNGPVRISVSLGTGWLTSEAIDSLRRGLEQPSLKNATIELVPNPVLGARTVGDLANRLGVEVSDRKQGDRHGGQRVLVTTGGYNSVCSALESGAAPLIVHDARSSSVSRRAKALSDHGVCAAMNLTVSEPAAFADEVLRLVEEDSARPNVRLDGVASAGQQVADLLHDGGSYGHSAA